MFEEPTESPEENPLDPVVRAKDKSDEFRMHAELAAVFEGTRKFDAQVLPSLNAEIARDVQRTIGKLEKSKSAEHPVLSEISIAEAKRLLSLPLEKDLSTNDYHIHRRPGEVMVVRWLEGAQVDSFYERLQAHFDAAMDGYKEDERQASEWKKDEKTLAYLAALDAIEFKMSDRYLRDMIRQHQLFVLSTQAADELNIQYLADYVMSIPVEEIVGEASAPPEAPTEQDLAWFFKLFALRGVIDGVERMCFFAYLQKTEETAW